MKTDTARLQEHTPGKWAEYFTEEQVVEFLLVFGAEWRAELGSTEWEGFWGRVHDWMHVRHRHLFPDPTYPNIHSEQMNLLCALHRYLMDHY